MTAATGTSRPRSTSPGGLSALAGTGTLIRLGLRRDRVKLPAWVAGLGIFVLYIGNALPLLAPTQEDLAALVPMFAQPVGRMFTGPAFGMDDPTYERFFAAGYTPYLFLLAALMNIFLVTRHTRQEEETGRAELVRANVAGRYAPLTAAIVVAFITNALVLVVVSGLAMANGFATTGSLLVGLGTALSGLAFAGVTAVTVQLSEFARPAAGMAGAVLGAAFVIRAVGDMAATGGSAVSWLSPLAWPAQTAPYVHDRWTPLLLLVLVAVAGTTAGYLLLGRRDFGASLVAVRPGRPHARPRLGTPSGLAMRLQRGGFLGWGTGILLLGVTDGAFARAMLDAGEDMPPAMAEMFSTDALLDGYSAFLGAFVTVLVAAYAVFGMRTLRVEEDSGRTDTVLATPIGRTGWLGSHLAVVAVGAVVISVVTGVCTGLAAAAVTGEADVIGTVTVAHLALVPAALVVAGLGAALYGWAPRLMAPLCWVLVVWMGVVQFFGELLQLPDALVALSPLHQLAAPPVEDFAAGPFLVVLGVAVGLALIGLIGFRRRQVNVVG